MNHVIVHFSGTVDGVHERDGRYFADVKISYTQPHMPELSRMEHIPIDEPTYHSFQKMLEEVKKHGTQTMVKEGFRLDINLEGKLIGTLKEIPT